MMAARSNKTSSTSHAGPVRFALAIACIASALSSASLAARGDTLADVEAIVDYETRQVMASGVTRVDAWKELLVRRGNTVWTERVLPASSARLQQQHDDEPEHMGHQHFNGDTAAKWLQRDADGRLVVRLVDRAHQAVVSIPRAEFGTVGVDGNFEAASSIVPAAVARAMSPAPGPVVDGAQWRTDRSGGWSHRVLWSESRQLAMKIESQRDDGSVRRMVTVKLRPLEAGRPAPWEQLSGYAAKHYDDYTD